MLKNWEMFQVPVKLIYLFKLSFVVGKYYIAIEPSLSLNPVKLDWLQTSSDVTFADTIWGDGKEMFFSWKYYTHTCMHVNEDIEEADYELKEKGWKRGRV
jgi:hypothetical protein